MDVNLKEAYCIICNVIMTCMSNDMQSAVCKSKKKMGVNLEEPYCIICNVMILDLFAKTGVMNLEDGMKKNHCWSVIMPMLRKKHSDRKFN